MDIHNLLQCMFWTGSFELVLLNTQTPVHDSTVYHVFCFCLSHIVDSEMTMLLIIEEGDIYHSLKSCNWFKAEDGNTYYTWWKGRISLAASSNILSILGDHRMGDYWAVCFSALRNMLQTSEWQLFREDAMYITPVSI